MNAFTDADRRLAVAVQGLYLANLLLAPGLAYLALLWLRLSGRTAESPLADGHLRSCLRIGLVGVVLPTIVAAYIHAVGGFITLGAWVAAEAYIVLVHTPLILIGLTGLLRAMAARPFRLPWIGPHESGGS